MISLRHIHLQTKLVFIQCQRHVGLDSRHVETVASGQCSLKSRIPGLFVSITSHSALCGYLSEPVYGLGHSDSQGPCRNT